MQLTLHIHQLQDQLVKVRPMLLKESTFWHIAQRYAGKMMHDARRKVFYLHDMVFCEMFFQKVEIYYENNQIVFWYNKSCGNICQNLHKQLDKLGIHCVPLQKSFILS